MPMYARGEEGPTEMATESRRWEGRIKGGKHRKGGGDVEDILRIY